MKKTDDDDDDDDDDVDVGGHWPAGLCINAPSLLALYILP